MNDDRSVKEGARLALGRRGARVEPTPPGLGQRARLRPLTLALLSALLLAGCGNAKDKEASYLEKGKALTEKGDYTGADVMFRNALQINPKSADAIYYLAANAERRGDAQAAYRLYVRVTEEKPTHVLAQAKVGQFYAVARQLDKAREQAAIAEKLDPENSQVLLLRGLIAFYDQDLDGTRQLAETVLRKDPGNTDATALLGRVLEKQGKDSEAIAAFDAAIKAHPKDVTLLLLKAQTLERLKQSEAAEAVYRDLATTDPATYDFRLALARSLERRGERPAAERVLREAIATKVGGSRPKIDLVDLFVARGDPASAEAELMKMAAASPEEYPLQFKLADQYLRADKRDQARQVLSDIVKRDSGGPNGIAARVALARMALIDKQPDQADALIAQIVSLEPGNADALMLRAGRSLEKNDPEPAIIDLRTVLRDAPAQRDALRMLARAYFLAGKNDLAEKELVKVVELDNQDINAKYDLAYLQARRGASQESLALLDEVAKAAPTAAAPVRAKAMMLIADKRWPEAEAAVQQLRELPDQKLLADMLTGVMLLARDRPKDALAAFEQARSLDPAALAPVRGIVRAYLQQGDAERAIQFLKKVTAERPNDPVLQNSYGELLLQHNRLDEAVAAFDKARALKPDWPLPYVNLARAQLARKNPAAALAVLDAGLAKIPDHPALLRGKGDAQFLLKQPEQSLVTYLRLVDLDPEDAAAANNAAALIADYQYRDPASLKRAGELVKRFEDSNAPNYLDTLGWVRYRAGDYELAKSALNRAVKRLPDDPSINYHLGMVRLQLGDRDGARAALEKAVVPGAAYPGLDEAKAALQKLGGPVTPR